MTNTNISTQDALNLFCDNCSKSINAMELKVRKTMADITEIKNNNLITVERNEHLLYKMSVMNDKLIENGQKIDKLNSQLMKYFAYGKQPKLHGNVPIPVVPEIPVQAVQAGTHTWAGVIPPEIPVQAVQAGTRNWGAAQNTGFTFNTK